MHFTQEIVRIYGQTEMGLVAVNTIEETVEEKNFSKNNLGTVLPGCAVKVSISFAVEKQFKNVLLFVRLSIPTLERS